MYTPAAVARRWLPAHLRPTLRALLCAAACAAPIGCGSDSPDADPDAGTIADAAPEPDAGPDPIQSSCEGASGTRLRQVLRQHGDGTSEFVRLLDTDFVEGCRFGPAGDGSLRCLPIVDGSPFADAVVRYTDVDCTAPIAQLNAPAGVPEPAYAREVVAPTDACAQPTSTFYTLGERVTIPPKTPIFLRDNTGCTAITPPVADFFAIGEELAPDSFVAGTESYSDGSRFGVRQVDGDDGARFCDVLAPLRDAELGDHTCQLRLSEDGSLRCLPIDVGPSSLFSDDLCAETIEVAVLGECNQDAAYVGDPAGGSCALRQRVRTVEAPLEDPTYQSTLDGCLPIAPPAVAHAIGATVSPFSFAEVIAEATPAGGDRLQRRDMVSDDLRVSTFQWIDTVLDQACAFVAAADGDQRCLPIESPLEVTARVVTRFTDPKCTIPITVATRDATCVEGEPRTALESIAGGLTRVLEIGEVQPGPLYQQALACDEEPAAQVFYQLGDEILPQEFVGGTEMVE
ncbi:MAG TPA: hypothetical protein VK698_26390 [Kofleriaceae bacterium]|nr:hypothetical protein [Kofleriaceae bacterium]